MQVIFNIVTKLKQREEWKIGNIYELSPPISSVFLNYFYIDGWNLPRLFLWLLVSYTIKLICQIKRMIQTRYYKLLCWTWGRLFFWESIYSTKSLIIHDLILWIQIKYCYRSMLEKKLCLQGSLFVQVQVKVNLW